MALCLTKILFVAVILCTLVEVLTWNAVVDAALITSPGDAQVAPPYGGGQKAPPSGANGTHVPALDCAGLCGVRCEQHSRPNVCLRACGTCCYRCKCVPPGTFGNRELCGACYTNMTTHGNRPKCP